MNASQSSIKEIDESQGTIEEANLYATNQSFAKEDLSGAIYERMVIVLPYRASEAIKMIEASFESINLEGLDLENARYLNTKELSDEEKADRSLNFLGGFEIMDSEFRMFIIEGLGGPGKAMDKFYR